MIEYAIIIQARMGSSRRPGKIAYEVLGNSLLYHQISRLRNQCDLPIIVATTNTSADDWTESLCKDMQVPCFRGSENDVMNRYLMAAQYFNVQNVIRVGGDDPLIDPQCINSLITTHQSNPDDFLYASHKYGWIYGTAAELVSIDALEKASHIVSNDIDKEHVVSYVRKSPLFSKNKISPSDSKLIRPEIFLSVDYQEDLDLVTQILTHFDQKKALYTFSQSDIISLYDSNTLHVNNHHLHQSFDEE